MNNCSKTNQDFRKCIFLISGYKCIAFGEPTGRIGRDCKYGRMDNMSTCGCSGLQMDERLYTQAEVDKIISNSMLYQIELSKMINSQADEISRLRSVIQIMANNL